MELVNKLPMPAFAFRQFDHNGDLDCVVGVRGTFEHVQGGSLKLMSEQEGFQWEDAYDGNPHSGVLLRQTDLTPGKPGTDITFLGSAHAPGGTPMKTWLCGLRLGPVDKTLRVHGKRFWQPVIREKWAGFRAREPKRVIADWQLTDAEPTTAVSMTWSNAYGGSIPGTGRPEENVPVDVEPDNPLGCGIVDLSMAADTPPQIAQSVTTRTEAGIDWRSRQEPQGMGPISPWWLSRQQYAGTYDDDWLASRHPLLPTDFDPRFWQCAPRDMVAIPWLEGNEAYELDHLHPTLQQASGRLPSLNLGVECHSGDQAEWNIARLDGVHFDWRVDGRVILTWRARFPLLEATNASLILRLDDKLGVGRHAA